MTAPAKASLKEYENDMTDEQMDALLERATARLKQKSNTAALATSDEHNKYTFPKLNTGKLDEAYVTSKGDVAMVDASRLLQAKQRKKANGIRKVEDPVSAKKFAEAVCLTYISPVIIATQ